MNGVLRCSPMRIAPRPTALMTKLPRRSRTTWLRRFARSVTTGFDFNGQPVALVVADTVLNSHDMPRRWFECEYDREPH